MKQWIPSPQDFAAKLFSQLRILHSLHHMSRVNPVREHKATRFSSTKWTTSHSEALNGSAKGQKTKPEEWRPWRKVGLNWKTVPKMMERIPAEQRKVQTTEELQLNLRDPGKFETKHAATLMSEATEQIETSKNPTRDPNLRTRTRISAKATRWPPVTVRQHQHKNTTQDQATRKRKSWARVTIKGTVRASD